MDANFLFSKLKTQMIPANCLQKGDCFHLKGQHDTIAVVSSIAYHTSHPDWKECVELVWESDNDTGIWVFGAYPSDSSSKWSEVLIVVRDSLRE